MSPIFKNAKTLSDERLSEPQHEQAGQQTPFENSNDDSKKMNKSTESAEQETRTWCCPLSLNNDKQSVKIINDGYIGYRPVCCGL